MDKSTLRKLYKEKRNALSVEACEQGSLQIANACQKLPLWSYSNFHLFLPIAHHKEVDTEPLLTLLKGRDKDVIVPKMEEDGQLSHFLLTDQTPIRNNALGIPEPQKGIAIQPHQIEVVFVPLLAFDRKGNRIGYGKGYYDRFLAGCKSDVVKVGLSFFKAHDEFLPTETTDVGLDYVVTPEKIYSF